MVGGDLGEVGDPGGEAGGLKRRGGLPSASAQCPACKQQLLSGYRGQGKGCMWRRKTLTWKGCESQERERSSGGEWTVLGTRVQLEARRAPSSDTLKTALGRHSSGVGEPGVTCAPL